MNTFGMTSLIAFISTLTFANASYAEDGNLPKAEDLFKSYADKVYQGVDLDDFSLRQSGKIIIEQFGVEGPMEIKYKGRDKYSIYINIFGTEIIRGCNAGRCWAQEFGQDMQLLEGDELARRLQGSDFGWLSNMDQYVDSMETVELSNFNDQAAYKVKTISKTGLEVFYYFGKDSGYLIGNTKTDDNGQVSYDYISNFKTIDKALLASEYFEGGGQAESLAVFSEFSFADIPDDEFDPPEDIQKLMQGDK